MKESELWEWVAKKMKIDAVPDPIQSEAADWVRDILNRDMPETREDLVSVVQDRMRFFREMEAWKEGRSRAEQEDSEDETTSTKTYSPELGSNEDPRSQAIEEYMAKIASREYRVYGFRE